MSKNPDISELFFSKTLDYLEVFLARQEQRSKETIKAYRISLKAFYQYVTDIRELDVMMFRFSDCTYEFVLEYSQYLQKEKMLTNSTVNQRLSALKSYLKYVADSDITMMQVYMGIQKVPFLKITKLQREIIGNEELGALFSEPEDTKIGRRDKMILILLFDSAVRVSELTGITLGDVSLDSAHTSIVIHGKGKKMRSIILNEKSAGHLKDYVLHYHHDDSSPETPLFYSVIHGKMNHMSQRNIERIVKKYGNLVRQEHTGLPERIYPHMFRRTRATGMYRDGVPLEMIALILGHSNSETTKQYAIPSVEQLREAISKGEPDKNIEKMWEGKEDEIRRMFGLN